MEVFVKYTGEFLPPSFQTHDKTDQVTLEVHRAARGLESRKQGFYHWHPWQELVKNERIKKVGWMITL